jgi:hypothetical protein
VCVCVCVRCVVLNSEKKGKEKKEKKRKRKRKCCWKKRNRKCAVLCRAVSIVASGERKETWTGRGREGKRDLHSSNFFFFFLQWSVRGRDQWFSGSLLGRDEEDSR